MSHSNQRKDKNCLNCNAEVVGKFCHICGQQNIHPKESFGHLVNHFFEDITHFDGKFFSTIKLLIARPGFLTTQYTLGRRNNFLNPIRLYVFTNALFFLIFFTFIQKDEAETTEGPATSGEVLQKLNNKIAGMQNTLATSADAKDSVFLNHEILQLKKSKAYLQINSTAADSINKSFNNGLIVAIGNKYATKKAYDSLQLQLPESKRDSWFYKKIQQKILIAKVKYNGNYSKIMDQIFHKFKHGFPQILFLSLPFFGLTLKILYLRQRNIFYSDHLIFSIHLYCGIFILLLAIFAATAIEQTYHLVFFKWLSDFIKIAILFYIYKAMRNFYLQGRVKTIIKYLIINIVMVFILIFLATGLLVFTAFQI